MNPALLKIADRLERQGKRLEAQGIRAVNAAYGHLSLADLVALVAQVSDRPAPPERVAELDRLLGAFRQAAANLAVPPQDMSDLLQGAVRSGVTAAADMLATAGGALEAFRVRPDAEIEFSRHAASRLERYWGKEQARLASEVETVLLEGLERGQSGQQMAARLRERVDVSRGRSRLIVANELGNASAYAQEQSQREAGVTHYTWWTAQDKRVRDEHEARHGKVFAWDSPPSGGHPGRAIRCRCVALAVLPPSGGEPLPEVGAAAEPPSMRQVLQQALQEFDASPKRLEDVRRFTAAVDEHLKRVGRPAPGIRLHGMTQTADMQEVEFDGWRITYGTDQERQAAARTLAALLRKPPAPSALARHTDRIVFTEERNKDDAYWEQRYGIPGFVSAATGGDGNIVVYNGNSTSLRDIAHEAGHNLAFYRYGGTTPSPATDYGRFLLTTKEAPPTRYAGVAPAEDFAESVGLYVTDPAKLQSVAPERYALIERILKEDRPWTP